jgi:hypothetical protein
VHNGNKLPPEVVDHWPEVFEDVEIKAVPLAYLESILVYFDDGNVWEIDLETAKIDNGDETLIEALSQELDDFFDEYDDAIESVEFRLDTKKVIKDVKERTKLFMKKRK